MRVAGGDQLLNAHIEPQTQESWAGCGVAVMVSWKQVTAIDPALMPSLESRVWGWSRQHVSYLQNPQAAGQGT